MPRHNPLFIHVQAKVHLTSMLLETVAADQLYAGAWGQNIVINDAHACHEVGRLRLCDDYSGWVAFWPQRFSSVSVCLEPLDNGTATDFRTALARLLSTCGFDVAALDALKDPQG
jgi:hypothetical protein